MTTNTTVVLVIVAATSTLYFEPAVALCPQTMVLAWPYLVYKLKDAFCPNFKSSELICLGLSESSSWHDLEAPEVLFW